jgi:large subunit ribosomal protein L21
MYAIIENGSHQFRVQQDQTITIDRRSEEPGTEITFDKVLLLAGDGAPVIGTPLVAGASVVGELLRTYRGRKILIQKFRRRKNYRRRRGHRQTYSVVKIKQINAPA